MEMVLKSNDDRGHREMKALVLNLLKDSSRCTDGTSESVLNYFTVRVEVA